MSDIEFRSFKRVDPETFLSIVNEASLRKHLIEHKPFTANSIREWVNQKLEIDALEGCCVRAIYIGGVLAGWCGIQPDDRGFELAIVLSQRYWGKGISVFKTLMRWAGELGHAEIVFHLLDSRPEYKALSRLASKVQKTQWSGRYFTTYYVPVRSLSQAD